MRDLGTDRMSWRRLKLMIDWVPPGSMLWMAMLGDRAPWPAEWHFQAAQFDALQVANWQRANEGKKRPSKPPDPLPRPGDVASKRDRAEAVRDALLAQRERLNARKKPRADPRPT